MRLLQTLQLPDNGDARALGAQLDIAALSIAATRPFAPFLAVVVALAGSNLVGYFGNRPLGGALTMAILVVLSDVGTGLLYKGYRKDVGAHTDYNGVRR